MGDDVVFARAEAFALDHAATPEQRRLLETAFRGRRAQLCQQAVSPDDLDCVYVPRWVYCAIHGDDTAALALAVVTTLLWVGIDLLDDLMDGDLPPDWQGYQAAEVSLAATTLISALAPLALSTLPAPPTTIVAMQHTLARGLLAMSGGQQRDLMMAGSAAVSVAAVEAAATGKTGDGVAMLAALAAQFAEAPGEVVAVYAEMGRALGTARQLHSDCYDLFAAPHSKDLTNGTRTLPIAWRLERMIGAEREQFLALLDRAQTDLAARAAVRAHLMKTGMLQICVLVIELYCERARQALARAQAREPAARALGRRIDETSFFPSEPDHQREESARCFPRV